MLSLEEAVRKVVVMLLQISARRAIRLKRPLKIASVLEDFQEEQREGVQTIIQNLHNHNPTLSSLTNLLEDLQTMDPVPRR